MKFPISSGFALAAVIACATPVGAQDAEQPANEPSADRLAADSDIAPPVTIQTVPAPAPPPIRTMRTVPPPAPRPSVIEPRAALPVADLATSEAKLQWFQSPVLFFPGKMEPGQATVLENDRMFEAPLAWAISAKLGADVVIDTGTRQVALAAGDIVPQVVLKTKAGVDPRYTLFCTRNKITQKRVSSGIFDKLQFGIEDSLRDAQWCLQDTDGDGSFDTAVGLNDGNKVSPAAPIAPVPYSISVAEPIPGGDDRITVKVTQVGKKDVVLVLSVTQMGKAMKFDTLQSGFHRASALTSLRYDGTTQGAASLLGMRFKVLSADRKANQATLEWQPAVRHPDEFVIIPLELHTY